VDVVAAVYGIKRLGIQKLIASPLPLGSGFVDTAHGTIPLPAPATMKLLEGIPIFDAGINFELVTPTGAALVRAFSSAFGRIPPLVIRKVGYGVGKRDLPDRPNLLRIVIGDDQWEQELDTVVVLESNLDDVSPEWMGYVMDLLFEAKALDVAFCPIQMKKNRPGVQIQVTARPEHQEALTGILFRETTTLGVRFQYTQRKVLKRSTTEIATPWGPIKVKKVIQEDGSSLYLPEYEACKEIARKIHRPLREIFYWIMALNTEALRERRPFVEENIQMDRKDPEN
jgi:hypothetical protein